MKKDFFISYNKADRQWAEWIGWQLEEEKYSVILQAWDFLPGSNFILEMQKASIDAERTLAVLSEDYLSALFTQPEWAAAFVNDPTGSGKKLVPVRVRKCEPGGMLTSIVYIDLVGLDEKAARDKLIDSIKIQRAKPATQPLFPGNITRTVASHPGFPSSGCAKVSTGKMPVTGKDVFGREKEIEKLDRAWAGGHTHIVWLTAWGGVGKTALVNHWLNQLAEKDYSGAARVYAWSFYSQGASSGKQASADEFFQETLAWFNDPDPKAGSSVDKARRLVGLIRQEKTLLILDGIEPLQYPPGEITGFAGRLKDAGLKVLLKELAASQPGLCLVSSREEPADLADKLEHTVQEIKLDELSEDAGVLLLKSLGATGADKEMKAAVKEYDGHALALTLLGNYIREVLEGDIRQRDKIPRLADDQKKGPHARRVMAAYETWLAGKPELNILRLMGLFDRPVDMAAIDALKAGEIIPGLTDQLNHLSAADWQYCLGRLQEARLLARDKTAKKTILDCHPLIREYFAGRVREENPTGWKQAHTRLYHYYKALAKERPDTLVEMEPLFAAVSHGCAAGLHQQALDEVYYPRIQRDANTNYCCNKLGAFGADLACVAHFFAKPWTEPAAGLKETTQAVVLSWAGFRLRALGRLTEAIQPMQASMKTAIKQNDFIGAAQDANNLSELLLTLGRVAEAVDYGKQSVDYADKSGDEFEKESDRTTLADALHQAGDLEEAERLFMEAEAMQKKDQPEYPYLYSLPGYRFCDLLLARGRYPEVIKRAEQTLKWVTEVNWLLDIALDTLSLARAHLQKIENETADDFRQDKPPVPERSRKQMNAPLGRVPIVDSALILQSQGTEGGPGGTARRAPTDYFNEAVAGLRKYGSQQHLPRGLFARAACLRLQGFYDRAQIDLDEALEIIELGSMTLYRVDYHLESGRLCRARGQTAEAQAHFQTAQALIAETGYHRRDREVEFPLSHKVR